MHHRLETLGYQCLERMRHNGQVNPGHVGDGRTPASSGVDDHSRSNGAAIGHHPIHAAVLAANAGHFGLRMNLNALPIRAASVAPDHSIMTNDAARRMIESRQDRLVWTVTDIEAGD